jgi:hypothetical protein
MRKVRDARFTGSRVVNTGEAEVASPGPVFDTSRKGGWVCCRAVSPDAKLREGGEVESLSLVSFRAEAFATSVDLEAGGNTAGSATTLDRASAGAFFFLSATGAFAEAASVFGAWSAKAMGIGTVPVGRRWRLARSACSYESSRASPASFAFSDAAVRPTAAFRPRAAFGVSCRVFVQAWKRPNTPSMSSVFGLKPGLPGPFCAPFMHREYRRLPRLVRTSRCGIDDRVSYRDEASQSSQNGKLSRYCVAPPRFR